jgi:O-antigen/teichoic acid export membrane protein
MNSSQRILLNTVATYGRSLLALGLALFSSRWVLAALGQSDYGLFAVVGSIIVFITFLNNVMSVSAARHFSFSIGRGDTEEVVRWFNASLGIHLVLPVALILAGWPVGEHLIRHVLVVPDGRVDACLLVFRLSLISAFTGMVSVPFLAMFSARQRLVEPAFWGLLQAALIFGLAWSLDRVPGDSLRIYAAGMVAIASGGHAVQSIRAWWLFPECRIERRYWFDGKKLQGIASFASWSLMGSLGKMASVQMPSFLLNLYHGTRANAAYGIATHVSNHASSLTVARMGAMSPEIIASEGRGDRSRVFDLALRTCKFATLLVLLFAVPLLIEMDYVLKAWLRIPPDHAAALCRGMLAILLVDKLTIGHMMAVNASGRIAGYQLTLGTINLLSVPLAWLFLRAGGEPPVVCWGCSSAISSFPRAASGGRVACFSFPHGAGSGACWFPWACCSLVCRPWRGCRASSCRLRSCGCWRPVRSASPPCCSAGGGLPWIAASGPFWHCRLPRWGRGWQAGWAVQRTPYDPDRPKRKLHGLRGVPKRLPRGCHPPDAG